ncbi:hypothetical protein AGMMS49546_38470 [Spirochaetia bacterium]|nr:hypothetical protein AGMMS49546_38470 [Spirochaetia bacterium]
MKKILIRSVMILFVMLFVVSSCSKTKSYSTVEEINLPVNKSDFQEGQGVDVNSNGAPDFIVRNGRFIGTVSGKDFGPATVANLNARKTTAPTQIKPTQIKPSAVPAAASAINYTNYTNFKNYVYYPARQFLDTTGWTLTSQRSHELPEEIKNKIRKIGDYLHGHYTYGTYKASDGIGQDDDHVFDCDDYAGLMYRMGREAGLEMYIISLPGHWANALRHGNTLYTVEPQGVTVKYRNTNKFGNFTVADYARYTEQIVVER